VSLLLSRKLVRGGFGRNTRFATLQVAPGSTIEVRLDPGDVAAGGEAWLPSPAGALLGID
jgi:hypothetical protein